MLVFLTLSKLKLKEKDILAAFYLFFLAIRRKKVTEVKHIFKPSADTFALKANDDFLVVPK